MRSLRWQLPGLLVVVPLMAPGYYIFIAYGRRPKWDSLPPWAQITLLLYLALATLALVAVVVYSVVWGSRERRHRKQFAARAALDALTPPKDMSTGPDTDMK